ncbi:MAG TPA: PIG-L family deacetylase [Ktedonobacterales bacterium]|nr:PIG-L family deacetylase [Ktedonobacterales bacterium]
MTESHLEHRATGTARLMGIFAHPDDESFGMAGTLARSTMTGHPTAIVCATRGEAGKIAEGVDATPENLGVVRERELRNACAAVGVYDVSFLDYVDGHLHEADEAEAVGRIVYHLRRFRPDVVATFEAKGGYGHLDHMAVHRHTLAAVVAAADPKRYPEQIAQGWQPHRVTKVYYTAIPRERLQEMRAEALKRGEDFIPGGDAGTIPVEEMGTPMAEITTFIRLNDNEFEAKKRSMFSHASQMPSDGPFRQANAEELRSFMGTETLTLAPPPISARSFPARETNVFAGLE